MGTSQAKTIDISVIIPVYNAVDTIDRCIASLTSQVTQWNYELLFIDDGSKDNSLSLLQGWKHRDKRIRVFSQSNSGVSLARNLGLQNASGNYVAFVDSDDWVDPYYLESLRNHAMSEMPGLVIGGYYRIKDGHVISDFQKEKMFYPDEYHRMMDDRRMWHLGFPWGKLYEMSIIKEHNVKFEKDINYCEDLIFLFSYLKYSKYVSFIENCGYHYNLVGTQSLLLSYNSFESELTCYRLFRKTVIDIKEKYNVSDIELLQTTDWLLYLALRAIKTMYRPGCNHKKKSERLSHLNKDLTDTDCFFFGSQVSRCGGVDKYICYLVNDRKFVLLDIVLSIFFSFRYSQLGKLYVKYHLK